MNRLYFTFPRAPSFRFESAPCEWWGFGLRLPTLGSIETHDGLGEMRKVIHLSANTQVQYSTTEYWFCFEVSVLGFGFWFARQSGY